MGKNKKLPTLDLKNIISKCKNLKKDQLLIFLLIGILLVVIAIPTSKKDTSDKDDKEQTEVMSTVSEDEKAAELEKRLKEALTRVNGVGDVEVMITMKSKGEKIVEKDIPGITKDSTETDSQGGTRSTKEISTSEATVFAQDENGRQMPYVIEELEPKVQGVLVIAGGGDDPVVAKNISDAIMALFQVEAHKIKIMKMN
jgi:stage III sporulation protein AG